MLHKGFKQQPLSKVFALGIAAIRMYVCCHTAPPLLECKKLLQCSVTMTKRSTALCKFCRKHIKVVQQSLAQMYFDCDMPVKLYVPAISRAWHHSLPNEQAPNGKHGKKGSNATSPEGVVVLSI